MVGIVLPLVEALHDRRDVFWAGKRPPRFDMVCCTEIYDPAKDFRVAPPYHQSFGLVFLVEADLGAFKQWPLILDEALRLLAPGGILVLRSRQHTHLKVQEIARFIWKWTKGCIEIISQQLVDADLTLSVRLTTTYRRSSSSESWTFGLIADRCDPNHIKSFVDSVAVVRSADAIDAEVIICGPEAIAKTVRAFGQGTKFIAVDSPKDRANSMALIKNALVAAAVKENVLIANEGGALGIDFASAARKFGGDFDIIVPRQLSHNGMPMPDWVMTDEQFDVFPAGWLDHGDYHPLVYPGETVTVGKRALLADFRWNEALLAPLSDQLDLGRRLQDAGIMLRLARNLTVIARPGKTYTIDRYQRLPWLEEDYVSINARDPSTRKIAAPEITRDVCLDFGEDEPDPCLLGVIFPIGWEKANGGYLWAIADGPTVSFRLTEQVNDVTLVLTFSRETENVAGVSINGCPASRSLALVLPQSIHILLDAARLPRSGNVHVQIHRQDAGKSLRLEGFALQGVRKRPNCVLGAPIPVQRGANSILAAGWNEPEPWGAWASRSRADIKLRPPQLPVNVRVRLGLQVALLTEAEKAHVVVTVGGVVMTSATFSVDSSRQEIQFVVPADLTVEGHILISLTSDYVVSATRSGNENDLRKLGVGLVSIVAEDADVASTEEHARLS